MVYLDYVKETAYGFKTKLLFFIDRIEKLRTNLGKGKRDLRILDIGCGNGRMVTVPLGEQGYAVIGIDAHASTIEQARKENVFENVEFEVGDIRESRIKNQESRIRGKFDVVVLSDILEHLSHPEELLNEVKNILNPHGIVLISIPNGYGPFEIENFILRKTGVLGMRRVFKRKKADAQTLNAESGHVRFFTQKSFENLMSGAGFKINVFKKGSFLCGSVSARLLSIAPVLEKLNVKVGRFLPAGMCSVWYFEARPRHEAHRCLSRQAAIEDAQTSEHPRLLMVSSSAFNPLSGGGITFTNLFHGWPKDKIACVHNDKIEPTKDVCDKYFYLGAKEFAWQFPFSIANWFGAQERMERVLRGTGGEKQVSEVSLRGESATKQSSWDKVDCFGPPCGPRNDMKVLKKLAPFFQRIIGNEVPTDVLISKQLKNFIEDFQPQVIYTILGSLPYIRLVQKIAQKYNLPVVIHMMDDWPAVRYRGILDFYRRWRMNRELRALIKDAAVCLSICDAMAEAYEKRYGREWKAFHNALDAEVWLKRSRKTWKRDSPFKLLYAGALMPDSQLFSLCDVCDAVDELDRSGLDVKLDIYAPWFSARHYRNMLERPSWVRVHDAPDKMDSEDLFAEADLLVLPVNFDEKTVKYIKYSMPTKVPAYMFSGTPTLAYGPHAVASIKYAQEWAYCVTKRDKAELCAAIKLLALDEKLREKLARGAQKLAMERHERKIVSAKFQQVLIDSARPS